MNIWCEFLGPSDRKHQNAIVHALRLCAPVGLTFSEGPRDGPGIVIFSEVSPAVTDYLREVTTDRLCRVAAIASSESIISQTNVWELLHTGASDVFVWKDSPIAVAAIMSKFARWHEVDELLASPIIKNQRVVRSRSWISLLRQVVEVAHFTDASVLLLGESGCGKELIAHLIHTLDQRPHKREFVILDCTTVVPELSGSEFFGHERGAFTGAVTVRDGAFALADGGTLFLDEVGELPLRLQAELLRVVQEQIYKRVGSNVWQQTKFRLVCATNRDLGEEQLQGRFRRDFFSRIAGWTLKIPPLRERVEDILPLVNHFIREAAPGQTIELDEAVRSFLLRREYRANVRDLKQLMARIMRRHVGPGPVTVGDIPEEERPLQTSSAAWRDTLFESRIRAALDEGLQLNDIGRVAKETAERIVLADENGNLGRAARRLGVSNRALQKRRASRRARVAISGNHA
jgi:transcriptional regulator with GAF, ATPase, and Fis domain